MRRHTFDFQSRVVDSNVLYCMMHTICRDQQKITCRVHSIVCINVRLEIQNSAILSVALPPHFYRVMWAMAE